MKIKIGERLYAPAAVDSVTLRDSMMLEVELAQAGIARSWVSIKASLEAMSAMSKEEAVAHPDWMLALCLTVWATRRAAGEQVSFFEAIDVPVTQVEVIQVDDHKPKAASSGKARSGRAAARPKRG